MKQCYEETLYCRVMYGSTVLVPKGKFDMGFNMVFAIANIICGNFFKKKAYFVLNLTITCETGF